MRHTWLSLYARPKRRSIKHATRRKVHRSVAKPSDKAPAVNARINSRRCASSSPEGRPRARRFRAPNPSPASALLVALRRSVSAVPISRLVCPCHHCGTHSDLSGSSVIYSSTGGSGRAVKSGLSGQASASVAALVITRRMPRPMVGSDCARRFTRAYPGMSGISNI